MIRRLRRKLHPVVLKRIYLGAVLPKLEYACPVWCGGLTQKLIKMHANFCRRNGTALPSLQTRFDYHTLVMFYKMHTKQAPSYLTSLLPPLSLQDQDTPLENFLTVSQLYQEPQLSIVSYLEQLLCGMPYLLMFNKEAQLSILLRSFSNPILKYKPSTILLCFLFCSSFLDYFFSIVSFSFLFLTSIGLLFLQSCLNICL